MRCPTVLLVKINGVETICVVNRHDCIDLANRTLGPKDFERSQVFCEADCVHKVRLIWFALFQLDYLISWTEVESELADGATDLPP